MIKSDSFKSREEWLKARENRIGGSEAACLLGLNPWKTNVQLWQEKKNPEQIEDIDNVAMKYGREAEPHIRALFELDHPYFEVNYKENNMWTNSEYPFAHASLDGWMHRHHVLDEMGILEIKTVTFHSMMQEREWEERLPNNYYCQILWYMMVTDATYAKLVALMHWEYRRRTPQIKTYDIERTEEVENDIKILADAGEKFWESLKKNKAPSLILPGI